MSLFESIKDSNSESSKVDYNQHYIQDAVVKKKKKKKKKLGGPQTLKITKMVRLSCIKILVLKKQRTKTRPRLSVCE